MAVHLERFAMEQAGEVDYLITWRDNEFVGRVSLTVSSCGCESTVLRIPEVAFVPPAVLTPPRPHEVGDPACGAPQTHQRITDLVVPNEAHGLFKCPCHAAPPLHLTGVQSSAHDVARGRVPEMPTETRWSAGSAARNPPVSSVVSRY